MIVAAVVVMFGLIWVPAVILIWRLASLRADLFGQQLRARDRERHDAIAIAERVVEKHLADPKWATNIHADERDRQARYDTSLSREEIRVAEVEEDTPPPPREFANTLEEAMQQ